MAAPQKITTLVGTRAGMVSLLLNSSANDRSGVSSVAYLTPDGAERLIGQLREALASMPREAQAGDIGLGWY